ncbi:hypothetical protein J5N97_014119 [Dioscorea zingiberensis]|uniref:3'-5' exonuclease domain-containing protein n=1 Tax=Dioscorea zingiberensis TaxID=325984 RepID=A0A9D5BU92_9LILI|nr:hypothetical protein J5N97_001347 [Dioscorea zingiberensis]KAJ0978645.1 hypothetical protein J5N97_014119 [Dioscorea zingiberensis]
MWQQTGGTAPPPATTYYDIEFAGDVIDTTVTCDGSVTADWIRSVRSFHRRLRTRPIVGLDCEWRPNFEPGGCNYVATLQLCSSRKCLILQLQHMEFIPQPLKDFLSDPNINFVGVGVENDASKLEDDYDLQCANPVDLDPFCMDYLGMATSGGGRRSLGLKAYAREILGVEMDKPRRVTMSNWEARVLSYSQIQYACIDAYVSFMLGRRVL